MLDMPKPRLSACSANDEGSPGNGLIAAVLALFAIRLYVAGHAGLVDDEAYYRLWSLAPSLSYLDHPPMVAWLIGAGRSIAGDTELGIRLIGPTLLVLGPALLWHNARLLYGPEIARRSVWIMLAMPLLAVGGVVITPDLPSVIFAGLVVLSLAEVARTQNPNWWLAVGLFAGLGLLSKYTNLFLGATILIWIVAVPGNTKWLRTPHFWIGGLLAAVIASPVIIWNADHDWASFAKQFGRVAATASPSLKYLTEFVASYIGLASPLIAVFSIVGLARVTRSAFSTRSNSDVLMAATIWPMLLYFMVHALHGRVDSNWPAPLYPAMAIAAALGIDSIATVWPRRVVFGTALATGFALIALIYAQALNPVVQFAKDPTQQMRGWPAFAATVERKRQESGAAWVATSSYATTGQLAYALKGKSEVAQLNERIRYEFLPALPAGLVTKPALYVETQSRADIDLLQSKYRAVTDLGVLHRDNASKDGATYRVFLLSDPKASPLGD